MKVTIKSITSPSLCRYISEFARVSRHRDHYAGKDAETDLAFCKNIWKLGHGNPFESIHIDFLIEDVSRVLLAQLTRYRLVTFNVESQRYVNYSNEPIGFILPDDLCGNGKKDEYTEAIEAVADAFMVYTGMIKKGIKLEDARYVLPGAMPTRLRMVCNFREFIHFWKQRTAPDAQSEIRNLASTMMLELIKEIKKNDEDNSEKLINFIVSHHAHNLKSLYDCVDYIMHNTAGNEAKLDAISNLLKEYQEFV